MSDEDPGELRRRSVTIAGHRTSISIENAFWRELKRIARRDGKSLNRLIAEVDARRARNLSSTLRVFVLEEILSRSARDG
jgi:predicted DNA-binding ribbon-helix-helix protein